MSTFGRFRKSQEPAKSEPDKQTHGSSDFDPQAHHLVLGYSRKISSGAQPDPTFERKSLSRDLKFNSLSLAELIFALSEECGIPIERIVHFLRTGLPGGGDQKIANLLERIAILAEQFGESERIALLSSGVVGDRTEIGPVLPEFDNVASIIKYCKAIESLKKLEGHDAIDLEYSNVEEDPGWK